MANTIGYLKSSCELVNLVNKFVVTHISRYNKEHDENKILVSHVPPIYFTIIYHRSHIAVYPGTKSLLRKIRSWRC